MFTHPAWQESTTACRSSSSTLPSLTTTWVERAAFSCWLSCRASRSARARCPRARARSSRTDSSAMTAIVASYIPSDPASNSSGTSTTIALGGGVADICCSRQVSTRWRTIGHSSASSQPRSPSAANTRVANSPRSITPPGATSDQSDRPPHREPRPTRTAHEPQHQSTEPRLRAAQAPPAPSTSQPRSHLLKRRRAARNEPYRPPSNPSRQASSNRPARRSTPRLQALPQLGSSSASGSSTSASATASGSTAASSSDGSSSSPEATRAVSSSSTTSSSATAVASGDEEGSSVAKTSSDRPSSGTSSISSAAGATIGRTGRT